ncbi:MAG: hypothetical protein PHI81_07695, partial [Synergistaceae bacterium]|nr:hypothetical protein [Synergistaceae bacterium]
REKAQNACLAIETRRINNDEWMTIIKNGENIAANWSNGIIGSGEINSSLILSNGETVKGLASGGQEHLSDILQNTDLPTHPNQWQNQWLSYNQLEAGGSLGVLGSDGLLPGHNSEGYGKIKLPTNPSSYPTSYELRRSYYTGSGGILSLEFNNYSSNQRFRCVKD